MFAIYVTVMAKQISFNQDVNIAYMIHEDNQTIIILPLQRVNKLSITMTILMIIS